MHRHIFFGVVAWLLGAATATAGSLLAVSLLGQGITGNSAQLLTQDAVNRELASESANAESSVPPTAPTTAQPSSAPTTPTSSPVPTSASPTLPPVKTSTALPATWDGTGSSGTGPSSTRPSGTGSGGTVLVSAGGEVVAACQAAGAYLVSWSPLQGYEVGYVTRGPAATASVTFESHLNRVTMVVSCSAGVPSATSYTRDE